jgi:hypothetical protein
MEKESDESPRENLHKKLKKKYLEVAGQKDGNSPTHSYQPKQQKKKTGIRVPLIENLRSRYQY